MLNIAQVRYSIALISQDAKECQNLLMGKQIRDRREIHIENMETLVRKAGSDAELGRQTYTNPTYFSQVRTGVKNPKSGEPRDFGPKVLRRLEKCTGKPRGWMDQDHSLEDQSPTPPGLDIVSVPQLRQWLEVPRFLAESGTYRPEQTVGISGIRLSSRAFALRVEDDSMVSGTQGSSYSPGEIIIVDPAYKWQSGDHVLVQIDAEARPAFKQIIKDAGKVWLRSFNPAYPTVEFTNDMRVIGVVVQKSLQIVDASRQPEDG